MTLRTLDQLIDQGVSGKQILVRADLNVPVQNGRVSDATRIRRTIPTINALIESGAKVILLSHFGRPKGQYERVYSLAPIADALSEAMGGVPVKFGVDCVGEPAKLAVSWLHDSEVLLLENVRFHEGETKNDAAFVKELAGLGDAFVNDAFSCSHRSHASITGLAEALPSYAGLALQSEIEALDKALTSPDRPVAAIVGGAKISTKIDVLQQLVEKVDKLIVGGGMANTFLFAKGVEVGQSLCEEELKPTALAIMDAAEKAGCEVLLPTDVVTAGNLAEGEDTAVVNVDDVAVDQMILDIGPETQEHWGEVLEQCKTVVWNGPLGAFEITPFDVGTVTIARWVAMLTKRGKINSIAGGGDVLAALTRAGLRGSLSYVSTAGGAFLEWLEGKTLPGVAVLMDE